MAAPPAGRSPDAQQHRHIGAHLLEDCRIGFGMKNGLAGGPIHTLEMVSQHGAFDFADGHRQGKRIRLALAGERTHHCKAAGVVVASLGQHQRRTALRLLPAAVIKALLQEPQEQWRSPVPTRALPSHNPSPRRQKKGGFAAALQTQPEQAPRFAPYRPSAALGLHDVRTKPISQF